MKKLIMFAIIGGLVYLNYVNPKLAAHQSALLDSLNQAGGVSEEFRDQVWRDVDFSNFIICSVTKTVLDSKMISIGYLNKVKVVNNQWAEEIVKKYENRGGY